jgi:uncharacterized protein YjiS (DUF1127 family)
MSFHSRNPFVPAELATAPTSHPSLLRRLAVTISVTRAVWAERTLMRRSLAQMDARSLRDAGLCPAAAAYEAGKPFWQPLGCLR